MFKQPLGLAVLLGGALLAAGCQSSEQPLGGSGGNTQTGSGGSGGGATGSGGSATGSGGTTGSGGSATGSGGSTGSGGASGSGGGGGGSGGGAGGSGGSGSGGADASVATDARDASAGGDGSAMLDAAPLMECATASIDRVQVWVAAMGEGNMVPSGGTILVREGNRYVGKIELIGNDWHVVPVYPTNTQGAGMVNLSNSAGFLLTYSATADFYVQMRPANHFGGGTQFGTKIPSTGGATQSFFVSFAKTNWGTIPGLGTATWPYEETLAQVRAFIFVGNSPNKIAFYGMRFDNFVPTCR